MLIEEKQLGIFERDNCAAKVCRSVLTAVLSIYLSCTQVTDPLFVLDKVCYFRFGDV